MNKYPYIVKLSFGYSVMYAALLVMLACMMWMCVLFTYQNVCISLKIQLLRLKSDFMTLESSAGLAALISHP